MNSYEEFLARAREAQPRKSFARELQHLYVDNGTLQILVKMILQQRDVLLEALVNRHIVDETSVRMAIGTQGQVSGMDTILQSIFEAMKEEKADEMEDRSASAP